MSASASNSKIAETKATEQPQQEVTPHVGVLEEDDEFEEFPVAGAYRCMPLSAVDR